MKIDQINDDFGKNVTQVTERRIAPRHKVSLRASVLITAVADANNGSGEEQYLALQGQLLDVSRSGLAIVISAEDRRELESLGKHYVLQLLLPLPARAIELEAVPARFAEMIVNPREKKRVLLGAQITKMSERDHVLFTDFIDQYETAN